MERNIKIRITKDGKVEVDSSVFKDCTEIADHLKKLLGSIERIDVKDESETDIGEGLNIDRE